MRQYKSFVLGVQVILLLQSALAGFERTAQPAVVTGRGWTGSAFTQFDQLWINPAAVTDASSFRSTIFFTPSPFQLPQLSGYGLLSGFPVGDLRCAAGIQTFGFSLYKESVGLISLGAELSEGFMAGTALHVSHVSVERYGSATAGVFDIGAVIALTESLHGAMVIQNLAGADFGREDDIPRTVIAGLSLSIDDAAVVNADVVKDLRYPASVRVGTDLALHTMLTVRAGVHSDPSRLFWGFSLTIAPFRIDYALASHGELGPSHSIGIAFY